MPVQQLDPESLARRAIAAARLEGQREGRDEIIVQLQHRMFMGGEEPLEAFVAVCGIDPPAGASA